MTKFEKMAKKAELLECAFNAILYRDRWDNMVDRWGDSQEVKPERAEMHIYYLYIANLIEEILDK